MWDSLLTPISPAPGSGATISTDGTATSQINLKTAGGTVKIPCDSLNSAGVVHVSAAGLMSSSAIVNADVSASAAIAQTKLSKSTQAVSGTSVGSPAALSLGATFVTVDNTANAQYIQLPDPTTCSGFSVLINCLGATSSKNLNLVRNGSEKIDGATSTKTVASSVKILLSSNGTDWFTCGLAVAS